MSCLLSGQCLFEAHRALSACGPSLAGNVFVLTLGVRELIGEVSLVLTPLYTQCSAAVAESPTQSLRRPSQPKELFAQSPNGVRVLLPYPPEDVLHVSLSRNCYKKWISWSARSEVQLIERGRPAGTER